jgi:hypothetical protein
MEATWDRSLRLVIGLGASCFELPRLSTAGLDVVGYVLFAAPIGGQTV